MEPNLAGSIYIKSFIKFVHFVPIGRQTWPPWAILNSDWPSLQTSSSLKPLGQMEPNLTGVIYGRSFMKFDNFVPILQQTWLPWAVLNSDWPSLQKSFSLKPLGQWNQTWQEASMGGPVWSLFILSRLDDKHGRHGQFLILTGRVFKNLLLWNHLAKWNQTWQEASMGGPLWSLLISFRSDDKHGRHGQFLILIGRVFKNLLLWNHLAKWNQTWQEASMGGPLWNLLISFQSDDKHGRHGQFLILIGRVFKNLLLWNHLAK